MFRFLGTEQAKGHVYHMYICIPIASGLISICFSFAPGINPGTGAHTVHNLQHCDFVFGNYVLNHSVYRPLIFGAHRRFLSMPLFSDVCACRENVQQNKNEPFFSLND